MNVKIASICPTTEAALVGGKLVMNYVPPGVDRRQAATLAKRNLDRKLPLLRQAAANGARIACLPEALSGTNKWNRSVSHEVCRELARRQWDRFCDTLSRAARELDMVIVASDYEVEDDRMFNAAAVFDHRGNLMGTYRKVHLAAPGEGAGLTAGDAFPVFATRHGRIGVCICWDIIFPESTQSLMLNGAELIVNSTWGHSGKQADFTVQARAHDACVPLVVSMWCGNGRIVDRDGSFLARCEMPRDWRGLIPDQIIYATVDPQAKRDWIQSNDHHARLLAERRPDAYAPLMDRPPVPRPPTHRKSKG